MFNFKSKKLDK